MHRYGTGPTQNKCYLTRRATRGNDVIDDSDPKSGQPLRDLERPNHVSLALLEWQTNLRTRIPAAAHAPRCQSQVELPRRPPGNLQ
jgi:hypothetical protein